MYFYPRSPCGERPPDSTPFSSNRAIFLSTLSLRRATVLSPRAFAPVCFISIHALLAESDKLLTVSIFIHTQFLSTLSLRRATVHYDNYNLHCVISIHALLAESDYLINTYHRIFGISIHALLAESDGILAHHARKIVEFLSTLSLRRATDQTILKVYGYGISIHALLAESDFTAFCVDCLKSIYFYPRSPCGERPLSMDSVDRR